LALLQQVYDRFTEGFDTADLKTAKCLLGALQLWVSWRPLHTGSSTRGRRNKRKRDAINGRHPETEQLIALSQNL
jgi:hypothetical protein